MIRQALASAGLGLADIDAVEAHGTGTTLGDPIEAGALLATYGQERENGKPLYLGSLKSNIGHAQAAAGVGGVIKTVLALRHGVLPKTLHVDEPSPHIDWDSGAVELLREPVPWEANGRPRRAGVSAFGAGGTNAHVILEEGPAVEEHDDPGAAPGDGAVFAFPLSGGDERALRANAEALSAHLSTRPELSPAAVGRTLALERPELAYRAAAIGSDREQLLAGLGAIADGSEDVSAVVRRDAGGPIFLFPGQGSQWRGMTVELIEASAVFARAMSDCEDALAPHVEWSLEDVLRVGENAPRLSRIDVVQPALFAVMVSLAALWRSSGVEPAAVLGHSQGEIAAVHVAGGLSLDDAARLVAKRSLALSLGTGWGGMALLATGTDDLSARIPSWSEELDLAAINGPSSIVVSGPDEPLDALLDRCQEEGIWTHRVRAAVGPGHSRAIEKGRTELLESAAGIAPRASQIPFHSSLMGGVIDTAELDAEYWYRNARETVRFGPTLRALVDSGHRRFIEVSPHPVLAMGLEEAFSGAEVGAAEGTFVASLNREDGGLDGFVRALGRAWGAGVEVDWDAVLPAAPRRVQLPTYRFQRKRFWPAPPALASGGDPAATGQVAVGHPLLGAAVERADGEGWVFTGRFGLETHPWLADHGGLGIVLVPGTAFVECALRAGAEIGCPVLRELTLEAPLVLDEGAVMQVQLTVAAADDDGCRAIAIHSRPQGAEAAADEGWTRHAGGFVASRAAAVAAPYETWPPAGAEEIEVGDFYELGAELGVEYGPAFQGLRAAWRKGEDLCVEVALPAEEVEAAASFEIHPALLDAVVHSTAVSGLEAGVPDASERELRLAFSFGEVQLRSTGATRLRAVLSPVDADTTAVWVGDETGATVASIGSFAMRPVPSQQLDSRDAAKAAMLSLDWLPAGEPPQPGQRLAVVGAGVEGLTDAVAHPDLAALLASIEAGAPVPDLVAMAVPDGAEHGGESVPERTLAATAEVLDLAQEWLSHELFDSARLALLTVAAAAVPGDERLPEPAQAASWGLIRSAQSEYPDRFVLVDVDGEEASWQALERALALAETNVAIRAGKTLVARLRRLSAESLDAALAAPDPWRLAGRAGTVLVTGGTGDLGGLVARHLVAEHGVGQLLLASRGGEAAAGAAELKQELEGLGARVRIAACDVADREQVAALLASVEGEEEPLVAVVHTAAVLADGVFETLNPERLEIALGAKAAGAWHLHELTREMDLAAFVLFSSCAGTLGTPAQANYAAANAFLDGLAAHRQTQGLAAASLAWGVWERTMKRGEALLGEDHLLRFARSGLVGIGDEAGMEMLDAALALGRPVLAPIGLNLPALRSRARKTVLAPIYRELVPQPLVRSDADAAAESLPALLAAVAASEREQVALTFVREQIADVLGLASAEAVAPQAPFLELGFDSLTALEFRNRLNGSTGLRLPPGVAFDHPTSAALAAHLVDQVGTPEAAREGDPSAGLISLLPVALAEGRMTELAEILSGVARFRETFAEPQAPDSEPYFLRLATGEAGPGLVCVPSAAPISGPHEYARLARRFDGERDAFALRWPGFAAGEALPADIEVAFGLQAAAIAAAVGERPFALLGHSTGGVLAYGLARHLERLGTGPAALVLVDSYHPAQRAIDDPTSLGVLSGLLQGEESGVTIDDARLTAMAAYLQLVATVEIAPLACPALLVRATEPIGGGADEAGWQPSWDVPLDVVDVPGDHLTMVDSCADSTGRAISAWLQANVAAD